MKGEERATFLGLKENNEGPFDIVILPIPYEMTTSYREGTEFGPDACIDASTQVELNDRILEENLPCGFNIHTSKPWDKEVSSLKEALASINQFCIPWMNGKQFPIVLGGEHGLLLPLIEAVKVHPKINQNLDKLENFRAFGGAQSYPSRTKDTDDVDYSTGSVGLGGAITIFGSLIQDYVAQHNFVSKNFKHGKMVALLGDAELDEGNIYEALLEGAKQNVRNCWWVIDYNRQSLDAVVADKLHLKIDELFASMGWRVITLKYGKKLQSLSKIKGGNEILNWIFKYIMEHRSLSSIFAQFDRYRNNRNVQNLLTIFIVVVGPALALLTLFYVNIIEQEIRSQSFRAILLADVLYVIIIASLVIKRIAIVVAARRAKSAGSRLHLRLTGVFAILALIPTILVAIFAMITINFGLEEWFSSRVSNVVKTSHAAALAYETEHEEGLRSDAITFASALDARYSQVSSVNPAILRLWLSEIQPQIQRGFREAYIINSSGKLILRGERSYEFNFEAPPENFLNMICLLYTSDDADE